MSNEEINQYNDTILRKNNALEQQKRDAFITSRTQQETLLNKWISSVMRNPEIYQMMKEKTGIDFATITAKNLIPHAFVDNPYEFKSEIEAEIEQVNSWIEITNAIKVKAHEELLAAKEKYDALGG